MIYIIDLNKIGYGRLCHRMLIGIYRCMRIKEKLLMKGTQCMKWIILLFSILSLAFQQASLYIIFKTTFEGKQYNYNQSYMIWKRGCDKSLNIIIPFLLKIWSSIFPETNFIMNTRSTLPFFQIPEQFKKEL